MTRHVSRSRAIAIANPNLSRSALAALRKKERRSDEDREKQQRRFDEAIPTARKVGADFPGGPDWEWNPPGATPSLHRDEEMVLNGTRVYRQSPTVSGHGRSVAHNGAASSAEPALGTGGGLFASMERIAVKAGISRGMIEAIGMQLGGCSVAEIAESMGLTASTVKGYLERGKAKMAAVVAEETTC